MMKTTVSTPEKFISQLPVERQEAVTKLRDTIRNHIPKGFEEVMFSGMIAYVVPHKLFPAGYHCNPSQPLFLMGIASNKNHVVLHHMGIYGNPELLSWFTTEYSKSTKTRLDMGKGCVRFKKADQIPYQLVAKLAKKISVKQWIEIYEKTFRRR